MQPSKASVLTFPATLFDYNGVLADDESVHLEAFRDALAPLGISISEAEYLERYLGFDDRGAFRAILNHSGREPTDAEVLALVAEKKPFYLARAETQLATFAGAAELVRRRASVGPVGVVSGALRDEIVLGLKRLGVSECVGPIVSAEDTRACKPDPEGYVIGIAQLAEQFGETVARKALVIEDSLAGIEAAKAAGLACAAVAHSYSASVLKDTSADLVVEALEELTDELISRLFRRLHA